MAKKYTSSSDKSTPALSVKEQAAEGPRFANSDQMRQALAKVMKAHGKALEKLAK